MFVPNFVKYLGGEDMADLKISKYNIFFEDYEGNMIAVNLLSRAIARVNKEKYEKIKEILRDPNREWKGEYEKLKRDLVFGRYLIEEQFDELQHLKMLNYTARFDRSSTTFTIMPTFECNFDCVYCYEKKTGPSMREETTQRIANYICKVSERKRTIHIGWFGGEPLIEFDTIRLINEQVKKVCEENKTNFSSSISTNGYLLDEKKALLFEELGIRNVQITLDGPPEFHDRYRPLKGGQGTFHVIFKNMSILLEETESVMVTLRINVGPDNYDSISNLLDMFEDFPKSRMRVYFRWIFQGSEDNKEFHTKVREFRGYGREAFEKLAIFYMEALKRNFNVMLPILTHHMYCEYDSISSILIGPRGEIYPCTVAVNEGEEIGRITEKGLEYDKVKYLNWHRLDPFEDEKCRECILLPLCMGGCRYTRVRNGYRGCPEERKAVESFARLWYVVKKHEKQSKSQCLALNRESDEN